MTLKEQREAIEIGDNTIIGFGSVVTKSILGNVIAADTGI